MQNFFADTATTGFFDMCPRSVVDKRIKLHRGEFPNCIYVVYIVYVSHVDIFPFCKP